MIIIIMCNIEVGFTVVMMQVSSTVHVHVAVLHSWAESLALETYSW